MIAFLAAILTFVAAAVGTALGVLLWGAGRGLNSTIALVALFVGVIAGAGAFLQTRRLPSNGSLRRGYTAWPVTPWGWLVVAAFALFAIRSFCWVAYQDGGHDGYHARLAVGNVNNLGDMSLHMLYARDFANGTRWWPEHPQAAGFAMRYYPGIDLFQALLLSVGASELPALVWVGLAGSLLSIIALRRWGGSFALAGFLFAGGLAGFQWFRTGEFIDFQAELAWKSLPLAIFVTQRPFLFALPAGLLLLAHWRERFFLGPPPIDPATGRALRWSRRGLIPFWVEWLLYAVMPAFHVFAFLFLSALLGWWFVAYIARARMRWHLLALAGAALLPASGLVYLMTDHFRASSNVTLQIGWMQHDEHFWKFWPYNFGAFAIMGPALWLLCAAAAGRVLVRWTGDESQLNRRRGNEHWGGLEAAAAFVLPAGVMFLAGCVWLFAPWEWDNTKLLVWCYLAALPFIWERFLRPLPAVGRGVAYAVLFFSGAATLAGGMGRPDPRLGLVDTAELDSVRVIVRDLPVEARFAALPDYNHPLVYCGRKLAMGYAGHLHSQGIDYAALETDLDALMRGLPGWKQAAARLGVRYVFWGPRELKRFPDSTLPWADPDEPVAAGDYGTVYEIRP